MSVYAIGDVQGCFAQLESLLDRIDFDSARDRLWFVGDLVNRGPRSLEVLRFVKALGESAVSVLGNHDFHLLMVAHSFSKKKERDTLDDVLAAPDHDELLSWLRGRPLMHVEDNDVLLHAGLLPAWSIAYARELAREVERALRAANYRDFLRVLYGDAPREWNDELSGHDRLRVIVNVLTRLRICDSDGRMKLDHKSEPRNAPAGYFPWFDAPRRASASARVICGHWASLGLVRRQNLLALDTGCVWGRRLTAVRLSDRKMFAVRCAAARSQ